MILIIISIKYFVYNICFELLNILKVIKSKRMNIYMSKLLI